MNTNLILVIPAPHQVRAKLQGVSKQILGIENWIPDNPFGLSGMTSLDIPRLASG